MLRNTPNIHLTASSFTASSSTSCRVFDTVVAFDICVILKGSNLAIDKRTGKGRVRLNGIRTDLFFLLVLAEILQEPF